MINFSTTNLDDKKHSNAIQRKQTEGIAETILTKNKCKLHAFLFKQRFFSTQLECCLTFRHTCYFECFLEYVLLFLDDNVDEKCE